LPASENLRTTGLVHRSKRGVAAASLDHLVGASDKRRRKFEAERFGRPEINDQLKLRGLLDRQDLTLTWALVPGRCSLNRAAPRLCHHQPLDQGFLMMRGAAIDYTSQSARRHRLFYDRFDHLVAMAMVDVIVDRGVVNWGVVHNEEEKNAVRAPPRGLLASAW
jgi:hypothetical protein